MVAFYVPPAGYMRRGPSKTFLGGVGNNTDATSISFGNFVAPSAGLLVTLLTCFGADNRSMNSVSIGGTNGTLHLTNGVSTRKVAVASRVVAAGTHNITAVLGGTNGTSPRNFCGCWLLTNYMSATPVFTEFNYASSTTSVAATHTMPSYAAAFYQVSETDSLPVFTQAVIDDVEDLGAHRGYWASRNVARQEGSITETATYGGSGTHLLLTAAIWT